MQILKLFQQSFDKSSKWGSGTKCRPKGIVLRRIMTKVCVELEMSLLVCSDKKSPKNKIYIYISSCADARSLNIDSVRLFYVLLSIYCTKSELN